VLAQGVDLVTFSGDKLLGAVQCGVIAGGKDLIEAIRKNPMKRALRVDKVTLAILNATLKHYVNPERLVEHLPLLRTLTLTQPQLQKRAETVLANLPNDLQGVIVPSKAQIGSGALPDRNIDSIAVSLDHSTLSAQKLAEALRYAAVPIIGRIKDQRVLLDMHGADPLEELIDVLNRVEI
jgi:L-seryl-tRNA(Ser) seleniumtransferase